MSPFALITKVSSAGHSTPTFSVLTESAFVVTAIKFSIDGQRHDPLDDLSSKNYGTYCKFSTVRTGYQRIMPKMATTTSDRHFLESQLASFQTLSVDAALTV